MSLDHKLQMIFSDHIEQMSKDLEKISNGEDSFVFKIYEKSLLISICEKVSELFKNEPIVLDLKGDCIVVGDLHGHIIDLYRIFTVFDLPPKTTYLFLGDIVDRGGFSIEAITLLFVLKLLFPANIYIIRGNHEFNTLSEKERESQNSASKHINSFVDQISSAYKHKNRLDKQPENLKIVGAPKSSYSFSAHLKVNMHSLHNSSPSAIPSDSNIFNSSSFFTDVDAINKGKDGKSIERKPASVNQKKSQPNAPSISSGFTDRLYNSFCSAFSYIPLGARFGKSILCIHGGIGGNFTSIEKDIDTLERPIVNYDNAIIENILWSDPMAPEKEKEYKNLNFMTSPRGRGCIFGKVPLDIFMKTNHLSLLIRAHEVVESGIRFQFNNKLITVFSASSYINSYNNNSGVLKISKDNKVTTYSFPPFKFLPRESATFIYSNGKNINKQSTFSPAATYVSTFNSGTCIKLDNSSFAHNNIDIINKNANINNSESNDTSCKNGGSNDCYSVDSFYNISTNNNINVNKANESDESNEKKNVTKIISKTLIPHKRSTPSSALYRNHDHSNNSTRRRIKFSNSNIKKTFAEFTPATTFS